MVADLAVYTVVHQPRRLKLPAQPIPRGASVEEIAHCLFDERMNERYFQQVAQHSYYPAAQMFLDLVRQGMKLSLGLSLSFVRQAAAWDTALLDVFKELVAHENVELIGVEPYHSFLFLFDSPAFITWMRDMAQDLELIFGKRPVVTDTTEMCMSATIYDALDLAGFKGTFMDGRHSVLDWRSPTQLYHSGEEAPLAIPIEVARPRRTTRKMLVDNEQERGSNSPYLLTRHVGLSQDISYRFSNHHWSHYPLYADNYADWIHHTPGDMLVLSWDFETFGEHHRQESGIFDFMRALPGELYRRGVSTYTASQLIERHQERSHHLPLPIYPTTRAGSGDMSFFLGLESQRSVLRLMGDVYNMARLTGNAELIDMAIWLLQADNLHHTLLPFEWKALGLHGVAWEQQQVYRNALHAMQPYLPTRLARQPERKPTRRKENKVVEREPALSHVARHI